MNPKVFKIFLALWTLILILYSIFIVIFDGTSLFFWLLLALGILQFFTAVQKKPFFMILAVVLSILTISQIYYYQHLLQTVDSSGETWQKYGAL